MPTLIEDIKAIRKHKKVSLSELYEKTKVPAHIIEMIDNGTVFTQNPNNKTYIRSFIRTYSKALGISNDDIVQALDDHEVDVYDGFLAEKYINGSGDGSGGSKQTGPLPSTGSSQTSTEKKEGAKRKAETEKIKEEENQKKNKDDEKTQKNVSSKKIKASIPNKSVTDNSDLDEEDEKIRQTKSTHTSGDHSVNIRPDSTKSYNLNTPEPPSIGSIDWADTVKRFNPLESKSKIYLTLATVFCIILIASLGFYAFRAGIFPLKFDSLKGTTANIDEAVQLPIVPDTLAGDIENVNQDEQILVLPDTLQLIIYAANDKLEPVRIRSDINNILTPYWIEHREAIRVEFVDEVLVRGAFSEMELIFNGHIIENFQDLLNEDELVSISREYFNEDPSWLKVGTDTFPTDLAPPSIIREVSAE